MYKLDTAQVGNTVRMDATQLPYRLLLIGSDLLLVQAAQCFVTHGFSVHVMLPTHAVEPGVYAGLQRLNVPVTGFDTITSDILETAKLDVHYRRLYF